MNQSAIATSTPIKPAPRMIAEGGMWFFVLGDLLIFAAYFAAFMFYRGQETELFLQSQQHLNQTIAMANTVILLSSSLLVALATEAVREGKRGDSFKLLCLAFALGALFPILKMIEWIPKIEAGHTPGENLFFMFYYVMTGLHLLHVLLGLCIMAFMLRQLKTAKPNVQFVEVGGIYWHMVDVLWLVLLAVFYLLR